jgi:hypothetical protein
MPGFEPGRFIPDRPGAPAIALDADDVVLAEIAPGLSLDQFPAEFCRDFLPLIRSGNLSPVDRISVPAAQSGRSENPQIADECLVFNIPAIGLSQSLGRRHVD